MDPLHPARPFPEIARASLDYAAAFGPEARRRLEEDLAWFYRPENFDRFDERMEFSLVFGENATPQLRYNLFRLPVGRRALEWLDRLGVPSAVANPLFAPLSAHTPEFAVGADFTPDRQRNKLYFMRLHPAGGDRSAMAKDVVAAARAAGTAPRLPAPYDLGMTYLLATDFREGGEVFDLKLYHRMDPEEDGLFHREEADLHPRTRLAPDLLDFLRDTGFLREVHVCHRFVPGRPSPLGVVWNYELPPQATAGALHFLERSAPVTWERVGAPLVAAKERGAKITATYLGLEVSSSPALERLRLYFSVL